jgi:hypothetical protein
VKNYDVFGTKYKVKAADLTLYEAHGLCCNEKHTILLDKKLKGQDVYETMLHELGHAMFYTLGFRQTAIDLNLEELIVENFSKLICKHFELKPKP